MIKSTRRVLLMMLLPFSLYAQSYSEFSSPSVYFSPKDEVASKLISLIDTENRSIHMAIYSLTHRGILKALMRAQERGVRVELIVDPVSLKGSSSLGKLNDGGVVISVWYPGGGDFGKRKGSALMHNKFCIFGGRIVWTGSCDFTAPSDSINQENAIVLPFSGVSSIYLDQFHQLKNSGTIPYQEYLTKMVKKKKATSKDKKK